MYKRILVVLLLLASCTTDVSAPTTTVETTLEVTQEVTPTQETNFPTPVPLRYGYNKTTANYFIRTGPSVNSPKLLYPNGEDRKLLSGEEVGVDCYSQTDFWIQIYDPIEGYLGWVYKDALEIQGECDG